MIPRDYQRACRKAVLEEFKQGNSTLIVLPTGTGKTVVFSDIAKCMFPGRTMVLAHRQELIWQAKDKIERAAGLSVEVEMGEYKTNGSASGLFRKANVIVSTIQTQIAGGDGGGRLSKFDPMDFRLLVIDEAHHSTSPSYQRAINYYRSNPKLKVLGVTATPDRADEEALGQVFETVAYDYEILDAIHDGWLVPVEQQIVNIQGLDFSSVRTTAGDLNGADLAAIMESEKNLQGVAGATLDIIGDKRCLVFTSSVKHAEQTSEIFNRHKMGMSAWVCGKTDKDERRQINEQFHKGEIQVLCNCGTHTEGFDSPGVEVVVMARPTKSRALYAQMVGRTTRPLPGVVDDCAQIPEARREAIACSAKPTCLVIDFVGNSGKHKLMTTADILGGNVSEEAIESAVIKARKTGKPMKMADLLDEEQLHIEREKRRLEDQARRSRLVAKAQYCLTSVDPFDVLQLKPIAERAWDKNKTLSERQRNMLRQNGLNPDKLPYGKARQFIKEVFERRDKNLATIKQLKVLQRNGINDATLTFDQASKTIDAMAKNGWHLPKGFEIPEPEKRETVTAVTEDDNVPF